MLLHQDGHGQKPVVVLMMVYFPDGKTISPGRSFSLPFILQKDVAGSNLVFSVLV